MQRHLDRRLRDIDDQVEQHRLALRRLSVVTIIYLVILVACLAYPWRHEIIDILRRIL